MPPQHNSPLHRRSSEYTAQDRAAMTIAPMAQSSGVTRLRNDESWVEITSQPSSSSLSSTDEIVTTGLQVQQIPNIRRRRSQPSHPAYIHLAPRHATSTSSQEEYEDSSSESDHVMTSSNEHILPTTSHQEFVAGPVESESEDEDENATALGRRTDAGHAQAFTPQPNAFSHPPSASAQRSGVPGSYFPSQAGTRQSYPPRVGRQHSGYSNTVDHDAALRASLNTLLSIGAAAARGLPKRNQPLPVTSNEPMNLRFVPESELMAVPPPPPNANTSRPLTPSTRARSSPSVSSQEAVEKGKRKAASGEKSRATKKKRMQALQEEGILSPTLMAWVMSAGVVVLVSVVGFGAGYVIGREVGRGEVMAVNGGSLGGAGCAREVARGGTGTLRKFRWGIGGRGVVA